MIYDRVRNPKGVRCSLFDNQVNLYGRNPKTGFARRVFDNIGVQYGLSAFNSGQISAEQFVELNEKAGGYDDDGNLVASRSIADAQALRAVYRRGLINTGGGGLATTPIIDLRPYTDTVADIHDSVRSFATRARLKAANGSADNQVMLIVPGEHDVRAALAHIRRVPYRERRASNPNTPFDESSMSDPSAAYGARIRETVRQMDQWLDNITRDTSAAPLAQKVARNKPKDLVDACWTPKGEKVAGTGTFDKQGRCGQLYNIHSDPRIAAGGPLSGDVLKCKLKPIRNSDYTRPLSSDQFARLKSTFRTGVCDYSRPGIAQEVTHAAW